MSEKGTLEFVSTNGAVWTRSAPDPQDWERWGKGYQQYVSGQASIHEIMSFEAFVRINEQADRDQAEHDPA